MKRFLRRAAIVLAVLVTLLYGAWWWLLRSFCSGCGEAGCRGAWL